MNERRGTIGIDGALGNGIAQDNWKTGSSLSVASLVFASIGSSNLQSALCSYSVATTAID
jgi:hypothetical protein